MLPEKISRLIQEFNKLPGIGPKSAERLTFYLLKKDKQQLKEFADSLGTLQEGIVYCQDCCNISESDICKICANESRDSAQLCVVEEPMDVFVLEQTGAYKGKYHVLHGAISPIDGVGPEQLTVDKLMRRLDESVVEELILATNPTVTGEATAVYVSRQVKPRNVRVTHLAQGLPMGGELEFADQDTLKRALSGRMEM